MLPVYPILCLLAAYGVVALATRLARRCAALGPGARAALVLLQGLVFSVHNDLVLAQADTRMVARDWMEQHIPVGTKIVMEPIAPDQWATDAGQPLFDDHGGTGSATAGTSGAPRARASSTARHETGGTCPVVKLEDYERTTRPDLIGSYERGGFCWVVTGSTQYGRAYADPQEVPTRSRTTTSSSAAARWSSASRPYGEAPSAAVLVRLLVQLLPARLRPPGAGDRHLPARMATLRPR